MNEHKWKRLWCGKIGFLSQINWDLICHCLAVCTWLSHVWVDFYSLKWGQWNLLPNAVMQLKIRRDQTLFWALVSLRRSTISGAKERGKLDQNKSRCGQCKSCVVRDISWGKMAETGHQWHHWVTHVCDDDSMPFRKCDSKKKVRHVEFIRGVFFKSWV